MRLTKIRRLLLLSSSALVIFAVAAGLALGRPPSSRAPTVTLSAKPSVLTFGQSTQLSGQLRRAPGGTMVDLQEDPYPYDTFNSVAQVAVPNNGNFSFTRKPRRHTRYRVVVPSLPTVTSPIPTVTVRLRPSLRVSTTSPRKGQRVRFSGLIAPAHPRALVSVQRKNTLGVWRTVARTRSKAYTAARSRYGLFVRVFRSAAYRVRVRGDADHASNNTSERFLTVR